MQQLYSGWGDFVHLLGVKTERTARERIRRWRIPVKYVGRTPTLTLDALNEWWRKLPKKVRSEIGTIDAP